MRPILAITALSLCLWYGILQGAIAVTNALAPSFISNTEHNVHVTIAKAKSHVREQIAYLKSKLRIPV